MIRLSEASPVPLFSVEATEDVTSGLDKWVHLNGWVNLGFENY